MKGTPAIYLGQIVDKTHFRTFIYAPDGAKRLVESWDEFEECMQSGLWFATVDDAKLATSSKPKRVRTPAKPKEPEAVEEPEAIEECEEEAPLLADEGTFEVKNDDFLPKK